MSYLKHQFVAVTLIMSAGSISYAETVVDKDGVLGVGLDLSESFTLNINGRLKSKNSIPRLNKGFKNTDQRVYDDYRLDLSSFAAMIDWHPGSSGFRVSAGLLHNGGEPDIADSPTYLIRDQGNTAVKLGTLTDSVDPDKTAPYLGIGWMNKVDERGGFSFSAEAGVLFQDNSDIRLSTSNNLISDTNALQDESNRDDSWDNVEIYPVLNLGISYTY